MPDDLIEGMDEWNTRHHHRSGLVDRIRKEGVSVDEAEQATLAFLREWVDENTAPLCGNSVWNDRQFLAKEMPELLDFLHYRMVDVSTVKELSRAVVQGHSSVPQERPTWPLMISWNPLRNCNTFESTCSFLKPDAMWYRWGQPLCATT